MSRSTLGPLRAHLKAYLDKLRPEGIPLYVGEFGMANDAFNRDHWVRAMVGLFDEFGLGRTWWEYWATTDHKSFSATISSGAWRPFTDLLVNAPTESPTDTPLPTPSQPPSPSPAPTPTATPDFQP